MNERIKLLAQQAKLPDYLLEYGTELCVAPHLQRFAELIVQECVKVAMKSVGDDEPKEAWYLIQEHFGVEE